MLKGYKYNIVNSIIERKENVLEKVVIGNMINSIHE